MRYYLFCIQFFLLVSLGISQNTTNKTYTVKKERLAKIKSFNEMIPDFPKKFSWISLEVTVNVGGKHGTKYFKGSSLDGANLSFLGQAKSNSFIFISMKCRLENGEALYKKYKVNVVE